ncbi:hypothetical protein BDU57DRAFT_512600 [Ampelomyces quisqualis]|uniref:Uncharacterized protein n=1 Tax=Ampelomyces quisqualis TaxID=50730 RepID=A0A6A5QXU7_AMPQU|nr:hypothetical protein BDU57DRAFT_512600 [Ampelomyces quisqualis]
MGPASKKSISMRPRNILKAMRALPSPGGYCSVGRQALPDGVFWSADPSQHFAGPFAMKAELNKAMVAKYVQDGLVKHKANYYSRAFAEVFRDLEPKLQSLVGLVEEPVEFGHG